MATGNTSLFDYERQLNDLHQRYNDESATHQYARTMSQQRFSRDLEGFDRNYQKAFPSFTGGFAGRLGSGVQSGVFRQKLGDMVGGFNRDRSNMNTDFASSEANYVNQGASRDSAYQKAILQLQEEIARQRAMTDPYANL